MNEREKVMSNFRRMIELTDKAAREEFEEYYIVSKSRMDNYISCLEQGAESIKSLKAETALYSDREKAMREALEWACNHCVLQVMVCTDCPIATVREK
jgi:predicted transcriptional regulator